MDEATHAKIVMLIEQATFRKTNYIRPHEYIVQDNYPELHAAVSKLIDEEGYSEKFYTREYRYIDLGDYKYWVIEEILNREHKSISEEYKNKKGI